MGPSKTTVFCHFKRPTIKRIKFNFFFSFFTDQRGRTPLHFAAQHGQLPVCELIIANVENKNPMDREGHTPLYYAAKHGQMTVCQFIIENISDKNPLNPKDDYGCTLLHWAAEHGYLEVCQLIINYIEDKNPINSSRRTPLHYAASNGHLAICQLIMKYLTDPNPKGNFFYLLFFLSMSKKALKSARVYAHYFFTKKKKCNSKNSCFSRFTFMKRFTPDYQIRIPHSINLVFKKLINMAS